MDSTSPKFAKETIVCTASRNYNETEKQREQKSQQ